MPDPKKFVGGARRAVSNLLFSTDTSAIRSVVKRGCAKDSQEIEKVLSKFRTFWKAKGKGKSVATNEEIVIVEEKPDLFKTMGDAIGHAKALRTSEFLELSRRVVDRFNRLIALKSKNSATYEKVLEYWKEYVKVILERQQRDIS